MKYDRTWVCVSIVFAASFCVSAVAQEAGADRTAYRGAPSAAGGACCQTLGEVRQNIDRIDHAIVQLMAERGQYVSEAARFKLNPAEVEAPQRAEAVVQRAKRLAEEDGLSPAIAEATYRAMMRAFLEYEQAVVVQSVGKSPAGKP